MLAKTRAPLCAARRTAELAPQTPLTVDAVANTEADLARRDQLDSGRPVSPLRPADGAHELDTTGLTLDEAVAAIVELTRSSRGR